MKDRPLEVGDPNPEEDFGFLDRSMILAIRNLKAGMSFDQIRPLLTELSEYAKDSVLEQAQHLINTKREGEYLDE